MAIRSAPSTGYDFGTKRMYRRQVWKTARDLMKYYGFPVGDSDVLLMPSIEGDEIDVALSKGFRENRLHVVDRNTAILLSLRKRYPKIHIWGNEVPRALERISQAGVKLRFANLDLCGQACDSLFVELQSFSRYPCLDEAAGVAVTVLRGREPSGFMKRALDVCCHGANVCFAEKPTDDMRLKFLAYAMTSAGRAIPDLFTLERWHIYLSTTGQTMLWALFSIYSSSQRPDGKINATLPGRDRSVYALFGESTPWSVESAYRQMLAEVNR